MADIATFSLKRDTFSVFDPTATTGDMTTGAASQTVPLDGHQDEKMILHIINTSSTAGDDVLVTVTAGDGSFASGKTLTQVVGDAEEYYLGPLTSMDYKQTSGTNIGKVVITAAKATEAGTGVAGDIKLCAIFLP